MNIRGRRIFIVLVVALGLTFALAATGCACSQVVTIKNSTDRTIDVQLALPWPSYAIPSRGSCQFATTIAPGGTWSTAKSSRRDHASLPLKMPNGITILRLKPEGSILYEFRNFSLEHEDPIRVEVRQERQNDFLLYVESSGLNGLIEPTSLEHFFE